MVQGISCCDLLKTDQCGDQEWRRWNANQAIHKSVEHFSLGVLPLSLKGVPTKLVEHCCNAACPVIVSLYKAGCTSLDHLKLLDVGICIRVPDTQSILHSQTNLRLVAQFLYQWWIVADVPPEEIEAVGCFLHSVINMLIPGRSERIVAPRYLACLAVCRC